MIVSLLTVTETLLVYDRTPPWCMKKQPANDPDSLKEKMRHGAALG